MDGGHQGKELYVANEVGNSLQSDAFRFGEQVENSGSREPQSRISFWESFPDGLFGLHLHFPKKVPRESHAPQSELSWSLVMWQSQQTAQVSIIHSPETKEAPVDRPILIPQRTSWWLIPVLAGLHPSQLSIQGVDEVTNRLCEVAISVEQNTYRQFARKKMVPFLSPPITQGKINMDFNHPPI